MSTVRIPSTPSMRLDNCRVLVTGASSGIGLAAAAAVGQAGAHVVCAARGQNRLVEAVAALQEAGISAEPEVLDIADIDATAAYIASSSPFTAVVNAAGMARNVPSVGVKAADFDDVFAVNARGAYFLSTAYARRMMDLGAPGSMLHVSSQMGHVGGIDRTVYCASKHAVEGMVKAMAIEYGPHKIRINSIAPTFIRTPLTEPTFARPERLEWIMSKIHLGRTGEVEDIMGAVVFFASDASALITGTSLLIDGGWTAG